MRRLPYFLKDGPPLNRVDNTNPPILKAATLLRPFGATAAQAGHPCSAKVIDGALN